ncbi:MAG: type II toxin-antitoxin system RelE/ParE family toxin [Nanoarchaeota archaeon]|nr:type II toxin-antitoxin system RelE/ParE family toxin [Nanoarchaeota archaeon]
MYKIIFDKKALMDLNKLENGLKKRIWNKLQECKKNPHRYLKSLEDIKGFKLRIGNYRVIIDIQNENNILVVLKIGHRKNVYGR